MRGHIVSGEEKNCEPRILYSEKASFKSEGKIKIFPYELKQIICH